MANIFADMEGAASDKPKRFVFVLVDQFTMMAFANALECLRIANYVSGKTLYQWTVLSCDGAPVQCSNGTVMQPDSGLIETTHSDTIVVCSGMNVQAGTSPKLLGWLRKEARHGGVILGLCTGAYVLARAGLLDGKKATIHWENHDSFWEEFPEVDLKKSVYVMDGRRYTAAGGTATLDLVLKMIAVECGDEMANCVADTLIYNTIRTEQDTQRLSVPTRIGVRHPKLSKVIQIMEIQLEEPVSPAELAQELGISTRQLERLFRRYLQKSPKRYYMELRLQKARNLLMQTDMSVINVALACGFTSPSHFSKCYRSHYQTTPYRERGLKGGE